MFFIPPRCNWMWTSPPELSRLLGLPIHHHPSPGHRMRPRPDVSQVKNPQGTESEKTTGWKFHIWMFPKIVGEIPPNHPWINRVFHYKSSILGETPLFLETPIYSLWGWILSWHFPLAFRDQQSLFDTAQEPTKRGLQIQIGQLLQHQHHTHRITNLMVQYLHSITWKSSLCHFVIVYQKKQLWGHQVLLYISTDFPQETLQNNIYKVKGFFSRGNRLFWKEWVLFCFTFLAYSILTDLFFLYYSCQVVHVNSENLLWTSVWNKKVLQCQRTQPLFASFFQLNPGRLRWNLQITHLKRKMIWTKPPWLCSMINLQGCQLLLENIQVI